VIKAADIGLIARKRQLSGKLGGDDDRLQLADLGP